MQHDFDIATGDANTGSTFRAALNAALQALASNSSGTGNPNITYPYQFKVDTSVSPAVFYLRKGDNSAWARFGYIEATTGQLVLDAVDSLKADGAYRTASATPGANKIPVALSDGQIAGTWINYRRNLIINGDFRVQQEGTSKTGVSSPAYLDLLHFILASSGTWSLAYDTSSLPTDQTGYALKATVTTPDATVNANDNARLRFAIEGYDYLALYKKAQSVSFWVKSNKTGTYCIALRNGAADRSYVAEYTIAQADTWEKKSLTISTAPAGGTWNFTNGIGLDVQFALVAGSAFYTTAGAWQSGNYYATANQVNLADTLNNYIAIADVQLEAGPAATEFERRPYAADLALVQRYLEKSYDPATPPGTTTDTGAIVFVDPQVGGATTITFAVTKRAAPTVTIFSPTTGAAGSYRDVTSGADFVASVANVGVSNAHLGFAGHGAADETLRFHYVADARL